MGSTESDRAFENRSMQLIPSWLDYGSLTDCYSELAREKMWARIHLVPMLQAEEDRDQVRRYYSQQAMEQELMGSETKTYHGDRYGMVMIVA